VGGVVLLEDWLAAYGFSDPLAALRAGVPGAGLEYVALQWWLETNGHTSAGEAVTAGALDEVPPELESELRERAFADYHGMARDAALGKGEFREMFLPPPEDVDELHRLRQRSDSPPEDASLFRMRELAQRIVEAARKQHRRAPWRTSQ